MRAVGHCVKPRDFQSGSDGEARSSRSASSGGVVCRRFFPLGTLIYIKKAFEYACSIIILLYYLKIMFSYFYANIS